jgi:flagella basal body P-ring formation protein FlgA
MTMRGLARLWLVALAAFISASPVSAGSRPLPVPGQVIYPGDRITDAMLRDNQDALVGDAGDVIWDRAALVGKVARRTLLPGRAIPTVAVEEPRAVSTGTLVQLIYENDGLTIVTTAQALQNGFVGQVVQVRNVESGTIVSGLVQADGSVRVNGG